MLDAIVLNNFKLDSLHTKTNLSTIKNLFVLFYSKHSFLVKPYRKLLFFKYL